MEINEKKRERRELVFFLEGKKEIKVERQTTSDCKS